VLLLRVPALPPLPAPADPGVSKDKRLPVKGAARAARGRVWSSPLAAGVESTDMAEK
jgi:hypothetical protein